MVYRCCAEGCGRVPATLSMPKCEVRRRLWKERLGIQLPDEVILKKRVCRGHFRSSDFGCGEGGKLLESAIPQRDIQPDYKRPRPVPAYRRQRAAQHRFEETFPGTYTQSISERTALNEQKRTLVSKID